MSPQPERPLVDEDWFHGVLPREEVVRLLVNDGDYLVRQTTRNDETQVVLSVAWGGHKHFIVQTTSDVSGTRPARLMWWRKQAEKYNTRIWSE